MFSSGARLFSIKEIKEMSGSDIDPLFEEYLETASESVNRIVARWLPERRQKVVYSKLNLYVQDMETCSFDKSELGEIQAVVPINEQQQFITKLRLCFKCNRVFISREQLDAAKPCMQKHNISYSIIKPEGC